jgi:hypothetical protein
VEVHENEVVLRIIHGAGSNGMRENYIMIKGAGG